MPTVELSFEEFLRLVRAITPQLTAAERERLVGEIEAAFEVARSAAAQTDAPEPAPEPRRAVVGVPVAGGEASREGIGARPGGEPATGVVGAGDEAPEVSTSEGGERPAWERRLYRLFRPVRAKVKALRRSQVARLVRSSIKEVRQASRN